jgi:HK97 family phage major capsid protein
MSPHLSPHCGHGKGRRRPGRPLAEGEPSFWHLEPVAAAAAEDARAVVHWPATASSASGRQEQRKEGTCASSEILVALFLFGRQAKQGKTMSVRSRELREKRARIHAEAGELLKQKPFTQEMRRKFDLMLAEVDSLKNDIDREERAESASGRWHEIDGELRETTRPPEAQIGDGYEEAVDSGGERRYAKAFRSFLRHGLVQGERGGQPMAAEDRQVFLSRQAEARDMGVGTGSEGGYIVPQGFVYNVEKAMKFYGQMLEAGDIMETATGQPLPWPLLDDTSISGEQISENNPVNKQDLTLSSQTFGAFKYSTKMIPVSLELAQDSAFDIGAFIEEQFAIRLGRILNNKFTLGAGTTEPQGIVTAATVGVAAAAGSAANTGGSETGATSIGSNDLFDLEHSVDVAYRTGASWMMHDTTLKSLKKILDKYGRPLWTPALAAGQSDLLCGYPYFLNNDMATITASAKTVLFGQMKKYKIRKVMGLRVLRLVERFADYGQIAFLGFARYDGQLLDAGQHPVKVLVQHS